MDALFHSIKYIHYAFLMTQQSVKIHSRILLYDRGKCDTEMKSLLWKQRPGEVKHHIGVAKIVDKSLNTKFIK